MKLISFSALFPVVFLLVACDKQENTEKFPGFTAIGTNKEAAKYYIDTNTIKRRTNGLVSFNMVRVLPNGYAIQNAETDCKTNFNFFEGVKFRDDGTSEEKFIAETLTLTSKDNSDINTLVTMACDKAEENRIIAGAFNDGKALEILYGSYQSTTQTALWDKLEPPNTLEGYESFLGKSGTVKILDSKDFIQQGKTKHIVLTSTSVDDSSQVLLNASVFVKIDNEWHVEAEYPYIKVAKDGVHRSIRWERIGKDRYGALEIITYHEETTYNDTKVYNKYGYITLYELDNVSFNNRLEYSKRIESSENPNLDLAITFEELDKNYSYATITTDDGIENTQEIYQFKNDKYVPIWIDALKELFDITDSSGKDELSSVWFEKTFKDDHSNRSHVVFIVTSWDGGHSDGAKLSAVTYSYVSEQWVHVSKQIKFAEVGNFGNAPQNNRAELFELKPDKPVILIKDGGGGQGYEISGMHLLLFHNNKWRDLGFVQTDEFNGASFQCIEKHQCWNFEGKISVIKSKKEIPDLLVIKTGTEINNKENIVPAKNTIYVFNGKEYEEKQQKNTISSASVNMQKATSILKEENLTLPRLKQAYDLYQITLIKDPRNPEALSGINIIANKMSAMESAQKYERK